MNQEKTNTIRSIAWGYFFLFINFSLNNWSLLPAWFAWYKFGRAIGGLKEIRPKLVLLENFVPPLLVWSLLEWQQFFELPGWLRPVGVLLSLMTLYFHFHLLTELSALASDALAQRLLRCRTASVVMQTALALAGALPLPQSAIAALALPLVLAGFVVCIYIMTSVFRLAGELEEAGVQN